MTTDRSGFNVAVLAVCSGLLMVGNITLIAEAALVGHMLADDKALATLPISAQQLFSMLTTFPASFLMKQIGRRAGFTVGAVFGVVGTAIASWAIIQGSFWLFCVGCALNGIYGGFGLFYRFAAVDAASAAWRPRAISYVMAGGLLAALIGPEMAKLTKDLFTPYVFAGSFAALSALGLVAMALIQLIQIPRPTEAERRESGRPILEIAAQPRFIVAVLGGMIGYAGMSFLMAATPLAMLACNHPFESAAFVIQGHVIAMFAPSFFTGHLITRFGVLRVMFAGAILFIFSAAVNLSGIAVAHFSVGLILLGLGWNLLFVGATTLLTETHTSAEKAKVQATNDFLVFGSVTLGSLASGALHYRFGWDWLNIGMLPVMVALGAAILWEATRTRPARA